MTTHDAAAALADAVLGADDPDRDHLYTDITRRYGEHPAHPLVVQLAEGKRTLNSAARALIREYVLYLRAATEVVHEVVQRRAGT